MEAAFSWIINIVLTIYLVIDSRKHGKNPILWGILGFVFGFIALGIYFIKTDRKVIGWIITILSILGYLAIIVLFGLAALLLLGA